MTKPAPNRLTAIVKGTPLPDGRTVPQHIRRMYTETLSRSDTANRAASQLAAYPCVHRGQVLREDTSNLCGSRGEQVRIFACAIHGECSLATYCNAQRVRTCARCGDRKTPEVLGSPFPAQPGPSPWRSRSGTPEFVSLATLSRDVRRLATLIPPDTSCIVGVARSGVAAAATVAMLLHLPLWICRQSRGDLVESGSGWRLTGNTGGKGPAVVIDDTVMTGNSFKHVMPIVWQKFPRAISAALYVNPHARLRPDIYSRELPHPHLLEWNLFNSIFSPHLATDFDGILCEDCPREDDDDGPRYASFLQKARPLYPQRRVRIPLIVTARLERWRGLTEQWLAQHGMSCDKLIMGPWKNNAARARADIGAWKGGHFRTFAARRHRHGPFFAESEPAQAKRIAEVSGRIVICPAAGRCYP